MASKIRIRVSQIFAWLLAAVGIGHCIFWSYTFLQQGSSMLYYGAISTGVSANIGEICLILASALRIWAALCIKPTDDCVNMAKARNMTVLSFLLFFVSEFTNAIWMCLFFTAAYSGNSIALTFVEFMLLDFLVFVLSIIQLILLHKWKKTAGGFTAARKSIGICTLIGVGICLIGNLIVGIPIIRNNASLKKIDAFNSFEFQTFDGGTMTQADLAGKYTILNIWETTCGPCKKEMPALENVSKSLEGSNVQICGLCFDICSEPEEGTASFEEAKSIIDERGVTYINLVPDKALIDVFSSLIDGFPTTLVLDEEGNVLELLVGAQEEAEWAALAEKYKN